MKIVRRLIGAVFAVFATMCAFAAPPLEQVPRPQTLHQQKIDLGGGGLVMEGMTVVQSRQLQKDQQLLLVKQRFDPPVMIKTVLPAGVVVQRRPWLEATTSPRIPTLCVLATHDQKVPDPSDVVTALNGGGSGSITDT